MINADLFLTKRGAKQTFHDTYAEALKECRNVASKLAIF